MEAPTARKDAVLRADEAVFRELSKVKRTVGLGATERSGAFGRRHRALAEQLDKIEAQRVREGADRLRVGEFHRSSPYAKDSFDSSRSQRLLW